VRRALLALLAAVTLAGCGSAAADVPDGRLSVVTTTNFITDAAQAIGGDRVHVDGLMGPGIDPHGYRASAGDVERLASADVIFYGGLELEGRMADVFEALSEARRTVAVTRGIPRERLLRKPGAPELPDPHVWFDPGLWAHAARAIADTYVTADPAHAAGYRARLRAYLQRVEAVDRAARRELAAVPARRRVLVTSHDAFAYFGRRYDFDVVAIQGISTAAEATTADIQRVAEVIARRGIRSVFVESSVPRQTIDAVIAAAERLGQPVGLGGELYSDAAGDAGTVEGTYPGMLAHNTRLIAEGLR
jgi:manganese/zinc/iron transport system substrate-binding protein